MDLFFCDLDIKDTNYSVVPVVSPLIVFLNGTRKFV